MVVRAMRGRQKSLSECFRKEWQMETQEKLIIRARLLASGIIRYWQWEKSMQVHLWVEIMAEELQAIQSQDEVLKIKENLLRYGLRVPEVATPPTVDTSDDVAPTVEINADTITSPVEEQDSAPPFIYNRRANNQVSECTEACVRDLLRRGLSKSAIARAIRVNRRVVIRVAREAQSAQQKQEHHTNDLGKSRETR
jgi:hypothetical protein